MRSINDELLVVTSMGIFEISHGIWMISRVWMITKQNIDGVLQQLTSQFVSFTNGDRVHLLVALHLSIRHSGKRHLSGPHLIMESPH